jgi:hypothetical protein
MFLLILIAYDLLVPFMLLWFVNVVLMKRPFYLRVWYKWILLDCPLFGSWSFVISRYNFQRTSNHMSLLPWMSIYLVVRLKYYRLGAGDGRRLNYLPLPSLSHSSIYWCFAGQTLSYYLSLSLYKSSDALCRTMVHHIVIRSSIR